MANLPLAFAESGIGAILLVAGISGSSLGDVIRGNVTMHGLSTGNGGSGSGASGTVTAQGTTPAGGFTAAKNVDSGIFSSGTSFAKAVLKGIGAPQTQGNIDAMIAWMQAESPTATADSLVMDANYNPLNTTLGGYSGATDINSDGVKSYASPTDGYNATVQTLLGTSAFSGIVDTLRGGVSSPSQLSQAVSAAGWGTGPFG